MRGRDCLGAGGGDESIEASSFMSDHDDGPEILAWEDGDSSYGGILVSTTR